MLTILYSFPNPLGNAGIGVTAIEQIRALTRLGHRCIVYCTSLSVPMEGVEVHETMRVAGRRIPHRAIGQERAWRRHDRVVSRALARRAAEIDVVHLWPQASLQTAMAAARAGIPSFREAPNTHTANAMEVGGRLADSFGITMARGYSHRPNERRVQREIAEYSAASRVLVPSPFVAQTFIDRGIPEQQLARHRYGCDLERFHRPAPDDAEHSGPVQFVFVGRVEPRKGLHLLAEAWERADLGDARLAVVGAIVDEYRPHVAAFLERSDVTHIDFTDAVADLMRSADVLVLPTLEEGSALVSYEAQAAGCALVVSDACGALADDRVHGLVHPAGDVDRLVADLERIVNQPALLRELRQNVLRDRDRLSWFEAGKVLAARYADALNDVAI